ncbi:NAC domain-containing protein 4-like isoform X1 [Hibiscus syriacus]|uniref:Protein ARV n=1 Tax=Hibiscus syriacus TaxID=106335 RepID=A0A6A3A424_HIBSY|nr:protein ARV 1-like [Hibiscus syriacus]KAE8697995.1 NAC domain-containing protein 4-like isoform X1 [Hibiscus syriacus]
MEYRCVQCGFRIKTLFVQYSPGNIRLMKCVNCKAVADEYIECELMIVLIDLILHKPKAYRHVLFNVLNHESTHFQGLLWKSLVGFLVLDAYRSLIVKKPEEEWGTSMSISSFFWIYRKVLVDVFLGNYMFLCSFFLAIKSLLKTSARFSSFRDLLLAILISSYFKILLIAMMVWEFPPAVIYIIDLFVFSSNSVALKVITKSTMNRCIWACFIAHVVKFCITQVFS